MLGIMLIEKGVLRSGKGISTAGRGYGAYKS